MLVLEMNVAVPIKKDIMQALSWIGDVRFDEGLTPDGASALLVYLVGKPKAKELRDGAKLSQAAQVVLNVFAKRNVPMWPHVRFISTEDQQVA
jgi:hypothetical protein